MKTCAACGKEAVPDRHFSRKSECAGCGADLHVCLNCRFYSETSHNKCVENRAEFQRTRDRANFCEYFEYRETDDMTPGKEKGPDPAADARNKLDELFRKQ
jgi:hypothetical protein